MQKDERDLLEVLRFELQFLKDGGYGRSPKTPWGPQYIFEVSLTCTARTRILFRIEIHASKGILENVLRPPRSLRRAAIAAIFQKLEFKS